MPDRVQMSNFTDITILDAILHIIDNKNNENPEYSNLALNIEEQKVNFYLKKHIIDALRDDKIAKAKFNVEPENFVLERVKESLNNLDSFVEESKRITLHLFQFMVRRNISAGSLILCRYRDSSNNICYAILKMDYNDYFVFERTEVDGVQVINLVPRSNGLPQTKQKLQKCAFIKAYDPQNEYDLLILDRQPNQTDEEIAVFFYKSFLNCTLCNDIRRNTSEFFNKSRVFITEAYNDDPVKAMEKLKILYSSLRSSDTFNANSFAEFAFGDDEEKKNRYIEEVVIKNDLVFESAIDKAYIEKQLDKITLKAVEGIEINMESHLLEENNTFKIDESTEVPGTYNITIRNIHLEGKNFKKKR